MDELTRLALVAAGGDRDAFAVLVQRSQADVWRLCAHLVDRDAADDLTQETYLRAARSLRRFRADAPARTWLLTIARRTCVDEIRRRTRRRGLQRRVDAGAAGLVTPSGAGEVELEQLIARLDEDQRSAFILTQIVGLSYAEAAAVCGCPVGTIRSRVARARQHLLVALEPSPRADAAEPRAGGNQA